MDRKGKEPVAVQKPQEEAPKQVPEFTLEQMNLLLGNQPQFLGEGLSEVYKGELVVAVKQFYKTERMLEELNNYSKLSHPNIVKLVGYYKAENDIVQPEDAEDYPIRSSLLVEFMPEGDLFDYLFEGNKPLLSWDKRISILLDIAKALTYLHEQGLVYRDLKAKNVLLDSELRAKLCDFGSLVPDRASAPYEGISGYFEVCTLRDGTPQIFHDVHAFGVLMLEVMLQRRAFKTKLGIKKSLVSKYYTMRLKRRAANMPSKKMNGEFEVQSLEALLKIAERCLLEEPTNYMRMETVMKELEKWSKS